MLNALSTALGLIVIFMVIGIGYMAFKVDSVLKKKDLTIAGLKAENKELTDVIGKLNSRKDRPERLRKGWIEHED